MAKQEKIDQDKDFYAFQLQELKAFGLIEDEDEKIADEISFLKNFDKVNDLAEEASSIIHEDFIDRLYELNRIVAKLATYKNEYAELSTKLDDEYYVVKDSLDELKSKLKAIDYDPSRLDDLEQRDSDLSSLKRKYKKSLPELIEYRDYLESSLGDNSNLSEQIAKAKANMSLSLQSCLNIGHELSEVRRKMAQVIERELEENMKALLLDAHFKVFFFPQEKEDDSILKEDGIDTIDFLIETNVGEGLKSLAKVISGGEASRISLAFEEVYIKANSIPTAIFDEIDTGLSGETAQAMAKKVKDISLFSQVIAITHMPQLASLSDHHILISKEVRGERTYAQAKNLNLEEKINQVAYLISGGKITNKQLEYAKEMVLGSK